MIGMHGHKRDKARTGNQTGLRTNKRGNQVRK